MPVESLRKIFQILATAESIIEQTISVYSICKNNMVWSDDGPALTQCVNESANENSWASKNIQCRYSCHYAPNGVPGAHNVRKKHKKKMQDPIWFYEPVIRILTVIYTNHVRIKMLKKILPY